MVLTHLSSRILVPVGYGSYVFFQYCFQLEFAAPPPPLVVAVAVAVVLMGNVLVVMDGGIVIMVFAVVVVVALGYGHVVVVVVVDDQGDKLKVMLGNRPCHSLCGTGAVGGIAAAGCDADVPV